LTPVLQLTSLTHFQGFEGFEPVDQPMKHGPSAKISDDRIHSIQI
jgi:hypothetical protein